VLNSSHCYPVRHILKYYSKSRKMYTFFQKIRQRKKIFRYFWNFSRKSLRKKKKTDTKCIYTIFSIFYI